MTTFSDWLGLQNGRGDPVGWLARISASDGQILYLRGLDDWRARLITLHVASAAYHLEATGRDMASPPDYLEALAMAWEEYNGGRLVCFGCGLKRSQISPAAVKVSGLCRKCAAERAKKFKGKGSP